MASIRDDQVRYPRRRIQRGLCRTIGRLLVKTLFRLEISGAENFPIEGPLIVVGNHSAVMEVILLTIYTPWQMEMLGASDIPHEKISQIIGDFYGYIPIRRGSMDRLALTQALGVLKQGGILGMFPEGGIWDTGAMRAQTGVAWLSHRSGAPVLPVGFSDMTGAIGAGLRLERPSLGMSVGRLLQAANPPPGQPRKPYYQEYAGRILETIENLIPDLVRKPSNTILNERFDLVVKALGTNGEASLDDSAIPQIDHKTQLAKLLHNPGVMKIFRSNLDLPTEILENLDDVVPPSEIRIGTEAILGYLDRENPYLLTYRFGPKEAEQMRTGLSELKTLAEWAELTDSSLIITPIRRYFLPGQKKEIIQTRQGRFENWM